MYYVLSSHLPFNTPPAVNPSAFTAVTSKDGRRVKKPAVMQVLPTSRLRFSLSSSLVTMILLPELRI